MVEPVAQERLGRRRIGRAAVELAVAVEQGRQSGKVREHGLANGERLGMGGAEGGVAFRGGLPL